MNYDSDNEYGNNENTNAEKNSKLKLGKLKRLNIIKLKHEMNQWLSPNKVNCV